MSRDDHECASVQADTDYPLPPDDHVECNLAVEADPVFPPPAPLPVASLAVPRARFALKGEVEAIKSGLAQLKKIELKEQVDLGPVTIDALVCGATLTRYPVSEKHSRVKHLRERARNGALHKYHPLALDELEDALAVVQAALVSLKAISALDERIPGAWGNLHPLELARKINGVGHALLRGRIAGMSL